MGSAHLGRIVRIGALPKSMQFIQMRHFVLRVDVPEKRLGGPLRAHKAVFTADNQTIGQREQAVEIVLRHKRQPHQLNRGRLKAIAGLLQRICGNHAGLLQALDDFFAGCKQPDGRAGLLPHFKPLRPYRAAVAEQQPFGAVFLRQAEAAAQLG